MTLTDTFADRMRRYKRINASFSDKLINAKFAMTIGTDDVYAEGVLAFYEIFKFLESAMRAQKGKNLGRLLISGLARTEACVEDLNSYLGSNWVIPYTIRDSALKFLDHLQQLYVKDPDLLIPYVYHLYMELLSGGQLLKTRKELENVFDPQDGNMLGTALVDFGHRKPEEMRERLTRVVNAIGDTLDDEKKVQLIIEGDKVFKLVNDVFRSMESVDRILTHRLIMFGFCVIGVIVAYLVVFN